jgi:hypothetical protein
MNGAAQIGATVLPDDNLLPGQSYTFVFTLKNWFSMPSQATVAGELQANAPDFLTNVQVVSTSGVGLLTNYYNVTFTYRGDGSDVASDVAASMLAAFAAGGDSFEVTAMTQGYTGYSAASDVSGAGAALGSTIGNTIGNAASAATSNFSFDVVLAIAAVFGIAWLLFEVGGLSGLKARMA